MSVFGIIGITPNTDAFHTVDVIDIFWNFPNIKEKENN